MHLLDLEFLENNIVKFTKRDKNIDVKLAEKNKKDLIGLTRGINEFGLAPTKSVEFTPEEASQICTKFGDLEVKKVIL